MTDHTERRPSTHTDGPPTTDRADNPPTTNRIGYAPATNHTTGPLTMNHTDSPPPATSTNGPALTGCADGPPITNHTDRHTAGLTGDGDRAADPTGDRDRENGPATAAGGAIGSAIRVLLVDDDPRFRETVADLVTATPGLAVAGEAGTGREAVMLAAARRPHVVLMDVRMPDLDGIAATEQITAMTPAVRVLVLTTFDLDDHVYRALHAGASGFVLKDITPPRLIDAIHTIAAGEALLAPTVTRRLIASSLRHTAPRRPLDGVTPREREILTLITRGMSNAEIETTLHISRGTLKTHIGNLLGKLDARDRAQLVIAGYEAGLADPFPPQQGSL